MLIDAFTHRLGAAVLFEDAFTGRAVTVPMDVQATTLPIVTGMPTLPWKAVRGLNDPAYRLMVSNQTVMPVGIVQLDVDIPGRQYQNFERLQVGPLPLPLSVPRPLRSDLLVRHSLWPTRVFRLPAGETAVIARFITGGANPIAGLRVTIWPAAAPMPPRPYGYTDSDGQLVYRLPGVKTVNGGVTSTSASLRIDVRLPPDPYAVAVVPTQVADDTGTVLGIPFLVRIGAANLLTISLP